jgi:tetratricopeptide (TPR) repeat protein
MDLKLGLLELLERAYKEEQVFVQRLSDERAAVGTPAQWSAKDVIAHIAAWKERTAQELAAMASDEPGPDFSNMDQFNARIFKEHQKLLWSDVLNKSKQAYRRLYEQTKVTPNDVLTDPKALDWHDGPIWWLIMGRGCNHSLGHLTQCYIEQGKIDYATGLQEEAAGLLLQLDESSDWQGLVHYGLARVYTGLGRIAKAIGELREAYRLTDLVEQSKEDPSLASIRENPEYHSLYTE